MIAFPILDLARCGEAFFRPWAFELPQTGYDRLSPVARCRGPRTELGE